MKPITKESMKNLDLKNLPRGANFILEDGEPVAVIMRADYYAYITAIIKQANKLMKEQYIKISTLKTKD